MTPKQLLHEPFAVSIIYREWNSANALTLSICSVLALIGVYLSAFSYLDLVVVCAASE
jgi:glucose uptake protein GlcU